MRGWRGPRCGIAMAMVVGMAACGDSSNTNEMPLPMGPEALLTEATTELSNGDFNDAFSLFNQLEDEEDFRCQAAYGKMLAKLLEVFNVLDTLAQVGGGAITNFAPRQQSFNGTIEGVVEPFEALFQAIGLNGATVIDEGCELEVPDGLTLAFGDPNATLSASLTIGNRFGEPMARSLVAFVNSVQAVVDYLLAHKLEVSDQFNQAIDVVTDAFAAVQEPEVDPETGEVVEEHSWVFLVRQSGVVPDLNPELAKFASTSRFAAVDDDLEAAFRAVFSRGPEGERGLIPAMMARGVTAPGEEFLAWIDDGDGVPGNNDRVIIGIRDVRVGGTVALNEIGGGLELILNPDFGDLGVVIENVHDVVDLLGDHMEAVDTDATPERLTLRPLNNIVAAIDFLDEASLNIPEAVEFDARAFFVDPKPLRDLVPYWYNAGGSTDVFIVEGEAARPLTNEPYVTDSDTAHFPDEFVFDDLSLSAGEQVEGARIGPDGLDPTNLGLETPLPYVLWQNPSLNGVIYIDTNRLPIAAEPPAEMRIASNFSLNKAVNSYIHEILLRELVTLP